jgi:hypothetical protein
MKQCKAELLKEDWTRVRPEVEVKKVIIPQGEETYILCRTAGRKEKAIRNPRSHRWTLCASSLVTTPTTLTNWIANSLKLVYK